MTGNAIADDQRTPAEAEQIPARMSGPASCAALFSRDAGIGSSYRSSVDDAIRAVVSFIGGCRRVCAAGSLAVTLGVIAGGAGLFCHR